MSRRRRNKEHVSRFVKLEHWLMKTEAWQSLDTVSRCAYIELSSRYAGPGSNNGRIPYSLLEMAQALHVSKATAMRALLRLQETGFIVLMKRGAFHVKVRHATEWRLTEYMCDVTGALATKEFARWRAPKSERGFTTKPDGFSGETARVS
jgi:hypothetical protein